MFAQTYRRPRALLFALSFILATLAPSSRAQQTEPLSPPQTQSTPDPDASPADRTETLFPHFASTRFWLSGQANFIFQAHPEFPAPYTGPHSLVSAL